MADDQTFHDLIEGYCRALSIRAGDTIEICVSTVADRYGLTVERWGAEREHVWSASGLPGTHHHDLFGHRVSPRPGVVAPVATIRSAIASM